jgi:ParB/RepB/Spo0J family partition protein
MTELTDPSAEGELRRVPVADITAEDGFNPRSSFDRRELEALAASVAQHGVLSPITVGPHNGSGYRLIAGERRLRAARDSGLAEIPAVVRYVDDHTAGLDLALLENIARADLTPLDEARAFARLIESGLTRKGVAERLSVSQRRVTERLQVLELPEALHDRVGEVVIPPGAIRPLVVLAKIDPELAELAVAKVAAGPAQAWDQPLTWSDVAQDPIAAVGSDYDDEQSAMPAHIYQPHVAYPVGRFSLSEKATKQLAKLSELRGVQPDAHRLSFRGEDVDAAEALGAVHRSSEGHVALIVGQQVADQLAGDAIARALTEERAHQRRQRAWHRDRAGAGIDGDPADPAKALSEEEAKQARRREREADQQARRAAAAYNAELGAEVLKHLSRTKVEERVVKVLAAVDVGGQLDAIAMRGARYGFPGWPQESTTKGDKPKVDYLDRGPAGSRAREYLAVAKTASDHAGRLLALIVMARYAKEDAVAQSKRSFSPLSVGRSLPWSEEVLDLVDELAAERLADHLTADVRDQRATQRTQDAERREHKQAIEERTGRLEELTAEQRDELLGEASLVLGPYSPQTSELRRRIEALAEGTEDAQQTDEPVEEEAQADAA